MSHGDRITKMPAGLRGGGRFGECAIRGDPGREAQILRADVSSRSRPYAGWGKADPQFRPQGCRPTGDWTMRAFREEAIEKIRAQVGKGKVICGLSGGVDSAVAAVLIHEAIGDQLTCVFVDHGLLRLNEAETVVDLFRHHYNIPLVHVDASKQFLGELAGVDRSRAEAQDHRHACSSMCSTRKPRKIGGADFLAQGTLYPDVIESVSFTGGPSVTIKSHHNVGGLPARMNMKLVEPLRELFKDEVRVLGRELGLPEDLCRPASVPRSGPCDPLSRRDHAGEARHPAQRRRRLYRSDPQGRLVRQDLAGVRGVAAGKDASA